MSRHLLFDLTSSEEAMKSLSSFIGKSKREIFLSLQRNSVGDYIDFKEIHTKLVEELKVNSDELHLNDVEIKSIHVTTGNDNGESFRKNGLMNLRETIKNDTLMSRFLFDNGIQLDIENRVVTYKKKQYLMKNEDEKFGVEKNYVYHKLFKDYLINGFHCYENPICYGGQVAYRPEFIAEVGKLIRNRQLEYDWAKAFNQCYIVEYKTSPYNYEWFNYQIDNLTEDEFNEDKDYYIKKWLIRQSINVIVSNIKGWGLPKIFSYMKFNYNVLSSEIIKVVDVTTERDNI